MFKLNFKNSFLFTEFRFSERNEKSTSSAFVAVLVQCRNSADDRETHIIDQEGRRAKKWDEPVCHECSRFRCIGSEYPLVPPGKRLVHSNKYSCTVAEILQNMTFLQKPVVERPVFSTVDEELPKSVEER